MGRLFKFCENLVFLLVLGETPFEVGGACENSEGLFNYNGPIKTVK